MLPILGHVAIISAHLNGRAPLLGIVIENIFDWFYFFSSHFITSPPRRKLHLSTVWTPPWFLFSQFSPASGTSPVSSQWLSTPVIAAMASNSPRRGSRTPCSVLAYVARPMPIFLAISSWLRPAFSRDIRMRCCSDITGIDPLDSIWPG